MMNVNHTCNGVDSFHRNLLLKLDYHFIYPAVVYAVTEINLQLLKYVYPYSKLPFANDVDSIVKNVFITNYRGSLRQKTTISVK